MLSDECQCLTVTYTLDNISVYSVALYLFKDLFPAPVNYFTPS